MGEVKALYDEELHSQTTIKHHISLLCRLLWSCSYVFMDCDCRLFMDSRK